VTITTPIWIAAGLMLLAGFYLAERPKYELRSLIDVLTVVAIPAWFFEVGLGAHDAQSSGLVGLVIIAWLVGVIGCHRWLRGRTGLLVGGIPAVAAGLLGLAMGAVGIDLPEAVREPVAFPAKAALPLLALVTGWTVNRLTRQLSLGSLPVIGGRPLGAKVVVLFLIIGLSPLAMMTVLNEQTGHDAVEQQQRQTLSTYSISLAEQIDNRIDSYQKDAFQLSQDPRIYRFLQGQGRRDDVVGQDAMAALQTFLISDPTYKLAFILDAKGFVRLSSDPELYARPDLSFRQYYQEAIKGSPYVSDISLGVNVPRPAALFLANPIRDEILRPVGVVALRVDAEKGIWPLFSRNRIGNHRGAILVDKDGVVIGVDPEALASSDQESALFGGMLFHSLATLTPAVKQRIVDNKSFGSIDVTGLGLDGLADRLNAAPRDTVDFSFGGRQDVAAFAHLERKPWSIVVISDLETFLGPVHVYTYRVIAVASILALMLVLVALVLARGISNPLDALARGALNVARGDLRQKLPIVSRDEIGNLTEAFNHMIENLERAQAELVDRANAQADLAQENARLYEHEREVVQELKRLNEMKTDFVSTVSHELRTPLTGIAGLIQTLRRGDIKLSDADRDECFVEMDNAARRLQAMVGDLLQVSAIDAGRLQIHAEATPVRLLWEQLAREFASVEHPCDVIFRTDPGLPTVLGDRLRLEQVLRNLVGNAIKYSPRGGRIETRAEPAGEVVRFSVRDEGIGMSAQEVGQLFNKFYRAGNVLTRKTQGTGLGLYICKSIVEAHGGTIWVESQPGAGSVFYFTAPLAPAAALRSTA
jgi:signal transduction histidine kinase